MPRDKALCMSQYAGKEGKGLMKQTVLKTTVAVLGAGLVSYLGTLAVPMLVLLGVMLLDYITGMIKAYIRAELNSKFGIKGILKSFAIWSWSQSVRRWIIFCAVQSSGPASRSM